LICTRVFKKISSASGGHVMATKLASFISMLYVNFVIVFVCYLMNYLL
jgi:hypothetical protein